MSDDHCETCILTECAHCKVALLLVDYLKRNPQIPILTLMTELGLVIAELIQASVVQEDYSSAVDYIAQSIRADVFNYDRDSVAVMFPKGTRAS